MSNNITRRQSSAASSLYLSSDLEEDRRSKREQENSAEKALEAVGSLLSTADNALTDLERDDKLGSAIVRGCNDLADAIGGLATQLEKQSDDERRALAKACIEDANHELLLEEKENYRPDAAVIESTSPSPLMEMTSMSEDDMMLALSGATSLLRDVEAAFRSVDRNDADEIADVALTLARLFLASLQDLYSTLTPRDIVEMATQQQSRGLSGGIEYLDDDMLVEMEQQSSSARSKRSKNRVRVLWPPLGPSVESACQWGKEEAGKQPLLAVALGLTLWPVAISAAMVSVPLVLADDLLQKTYDSFSDGPLVANLERGAAQLCATGRLCLLCGGLATRQTLRVASRQIERRGGAGKVAQDLGGMALDRAMHPVETFGMAWDGIVLGFGAISDVISTVKEMSEQNMERTNAANLYY